MELLERLSEIEAGLYERMSGIEALLTERVPDEFEPLVSVDRVSRFIATGTAGVGVELVVLVVLVELALTGEILGAIVGKEAALFVMFALNERWTFADSGRPGVRALGRRLAISHLSRGLGNGVALAIYTMLVLWAGVWYILSAVIGIAIGFFFNYFFEGTLTWRTHLFGPKE